VPQFVATFSRFQLSSLESQRNRRRATPRCSKTPHQAPPARLKRIASGAASRHSRSRHTSGIATAAMLASARIVAQAESMLLKCCTNSLSPGEPN
jgi:hypothetical protein